MYCEPKSRFGHSRFEFLHMNCELIFALLVLLIYIPSSLSLDYHSQIQFVFFHSQMYSIYDLNQ